jgi:Dyp-type peroxidase family
MSHDRHQAPPVEPVLDLEDIQGLIVPGFNKPHVRLIGVRYAASQAFDVRKFLGRFASEISSAGETLVNRRSFRALKRAQGVRHPQPQKVAVFTALAFSYQGLSKLKPSASGFESQAFKLGLAARSPLLGDPLDAENEGNVANWIVGKPGVESDALFIVAGDDHMLVRDRGEKLTRDLVNELRVTIAYEEEGNVRADLPGHEMFGFDDGVSQPGPRGRASSDPEDFVTERYVDPTTIPDAWLFGKPGQDLVWPGEFVFGYPSTSPDPLVPGRVASEGPPWTRNGSFLVFRRLRQDVGLFWTTMQKEAERLGALPGFERFDDVKVASRVVGRWPSGAPVNRVPAADDPALGANPSANNSFKFSADGVKLPLTHGDDPYALSKADPAGIVCPWAAHIRKVNTRDSGSDMGGRDSTYNRRILRRGIAFGRPPANRYAPQPAPVPLPEQRGLLFLSVQTSIEEQFEFLQARWMNDPSRPKMPGGHDLLVGQNPATGQSRMRKCVLFGAQLEQTTLRTDAQWVIPTGGGYFFLPSISALKGELGDA